jgi:peptide/nickel transport system substrate-binding protein
MRPWGKWISVGLMAMMLAVGCTSAQQEAPKQEEQKAVDSAPTKVLSITLDGAKAREPELQAIAGYLKQIGVDAQVRVWEYTVLVEEAKAGNREAYATDWGSATFSPFDLTIPKLKTKDRGNFSHYSNAEVDRLFEAASTTLDEAKAKEAYFKVQDILHQEAPWIFGYYRDTIEANSRDVKNWIPATDARINLHKVSLDGADTLVVGMRADRILSLDPANYRDRETETVIRNMFDGLVTRTPEGQVKAEIAESWTTPDDTTYIFKIRKGVKFHNGEELTVDDVVFTFNRILSKDGVDGKQSPRVGLLGPLTQVEKVDDSTVKMTLSTPSPAFLQLLVHTQIIPQQYYNQVGFQGFNEKPVGAGPFKFVSGTLNSEIVLDRFDGYWNGAPPLKKVIFRMMPEPLTRIAALRAGEVHIIQEVPPDNAAGLQQESKVQVQVAEGTRLYEIEFNVNSVSDVRVRQAINYAINWDEILKELYKGYARRVSTAMLPTGFGYNHDLKPYAYDPAKAKQLLREADYFTK